MLFAAASPDASCSGVSPALLPAALLLSTHKDVTQTASLGSGILTPAVGTDRRNGSSEGEMSSALPLGAAILLPGHSMQSSGAVRDPAGCVGQRHLQPGSSSPTFNMKRNLMKTQNQHELPQPFMACQVQKTHWGPRLSCRKPLL